MGDAWSFLSVVVPAVLGFLVARDKKQRSQLERELHSERKQRLALVAELSQCREWSGVKDGELNRTERQLRDTEHELRELQGKYIALQDKHKDCCAED